MRRLFGLVGLLLLVGLQPACDTIKNGYAAVQIVQGVKVTQNQLDTWKAGYITAVLVPYNTYKYEDLQFTRQRRYCTKSRPFSASDPCAKYAVLAKVQPIIVEVARQTAVLQTLVTACDKLNDQSSCTGIPAAKKAFDAAVSSAKVALVQFGVI